METKEQTIIDFLENTDDDELLTPEDVDKRIAKHLEEIKRCQKEIKLSKRRIENLEHKKKKIAYGENAPIFELADLLHKQECESCRKHGYCAFTLDSWNNFNPNWEPNTIKQENSRHEYYIKAKRIVDKARELGISLRKAFKLFETVSKI